jgi:hypothetical protein
MQPRPPRTYSWIRFATPNLSIVAALESGGHEFLFNGASVRVKLPPAVRAGDDDDARMQVVQWADDETPMIFGVLDVDVEVDQQNTPDLLKLADSPGPPRNDEPMIAELETFAGRAFVHWMRIVRWRTKNWRIGRRRLPRSTWGCALYEHRTTRRLASRATPNPVTSGRHATLEEWADIQTTLGAQVPAPFYYDLYFDGLEHLDAEDVNKAVLDFANACEVVLKALIARRLPEQHFNAARDYFMSAQPDVLVDGVGPSLLDPCVQGVLRTHRPMLNQLFAARSRIQQSDETVATTLDQGAQFGTATSALLSVAEGPCGLGVIDASKRG